jgi:hypothetical protein
MKRIWLAIGIILLLIGIALVPSRQADTPTTFSEDELIVIVKTDKHNYQIGEPVEISIYVQNHEDDDITIVFPTTKVADYSVDHYLWSAGKFFLQIIIYFTISSGGQKLLFHDHWKQISNDGNQVPSGTYGISGWMAQSLDYPAVYAELVYINIGTENQPPAKPTITGPAKGKVGVATQYNFTSTDPDNDDVYYFVDWGDQTNTSWIGPYQSGELITKSHTWSQRGSYTIKAKTKDTAGTESDWKAFPITMPYKSPQFPLLEWLMERFPHAFPILRHLMGY